MPLPIAAIASLAFKAGPAVIRGISGLFGGSDTATKVADIVEQTDQLLLSPADKQAAIEGELAKFPPEALLELEKLKVEMEKQVTRQQEIAAQDRQAEHHETQTTIRHSDNAKDPFVRRARPFIGVASAVAGFIYIISMAILNAFGKGLGPDLGTAAALLGLAGTFMGLRHVEKKQGTAS